MLKLGLCQPDAEFEWLRGSGTKKNQAVLLAIGIQVQGLIRLTQIFRALSRDRPDRFSGFGMSRRWDGRDPGMVRDTGIGLKLSVMTQKPRYFTGILQVLPGTLDGTVPPTQLRLLPVLPGGGAAGTGTNPGREFPDPDPEIPAGTKL